ncbi:MAG: COX15/CtaA family protein, partial [Leucobacter sp.]
MSSASTPTAAPARRERTEPSRFLRISTWISFVLNVVIIATGGAVRLTGSGLGCSEWPLCTPGSLVTTPELGIHGAIEFGNRTISGPILLFAVIVFVLSLMLRRRGDLIALSSVVLALVLLQAVVGGVIVWLHLNANLVGFHYIVSVLLVCLTAAYLVRAYDAPGPRERAVPRAFAILTHVSTLFMAITIFVGVLTTGAGPHSGDAGIVRDGFDAS